MIQLFQDVLTVRFERISNLRGLSFVKQRANRILSGDLWVHTHCTNVDKMVMFSFLPRCTASLTRLMRICHSDLEVFFKMPRPPTAPGDKDAAPVRQ